MSDCGNIRSASLSEFIATTAAKFIGVQTSDIVEYELSTDKLNDHDIKVLESELADLRFETDYWKEQINMMLKVNVH
jgi:DNA topoisomerase-6 subunit A